MLYRLLNIINISLIQMLINVLHYWCTNEICKIILNIELLSVMLSCVNTSSVFYVNKNISLQHLNKDTVKTMWKKNYGNKSEESNTQWLKQSLAFMKKILKAVTIKIL